MWMQLPYLEGAQLLWDKGLRAVNILLTPTPKQDRDAANSAAPSLEEKLPGEDALSQNKELAASTLTEEADRNAANTAAPSLEDKLPDEDTPSKDKEQASLTEKADMVTQGTKKESNLAHSSDVCLLANKNLIPMFEPFFAIIQENRRNARQ
jgi:hypothetical protein